MDKICKAKRELMLTGVAENKITTAYGRFEWERGAKKPDPSGETVSIESVGPF